MEFDRKVAVQAIDSFSQGADLSEIDAMIREQKVPGKLVVSYPGNGGRTSAIFETKPKVHRGSLATVLEVVDTE